MRLVVRQVSFSMPSVMSLALIPLSLLLNVSSPDSTIQGDSKISLSNVRKFQAVLTSSVHYQSTYCLSTDLNLYSTILIMYLYPDDIVTYFEAFCLSLGESIGEMLGPHFHGISTEKDYSCALSCCFIYSAKIR